MFVYNFVCLCHIELLHTVNTFEIIVLNLCDLEKKKWYDLLKNFEQSKPMYEHKILYSKHYLKIPVCTAVEVFCGSKDFLLKSIRPYYDLKKVRQTKVACKTPV